MKEKNDILSTIGKDSGFKVPENYFSDFAEKMAKSLPDQEIQPIPQPTRWQRVRPFVYMAAMFAGIWCMMQYDILTYEDSVAAEDFATLDSTAK